MPTHVYKKHDFPCRLPLDEGVLPHLTSALFEVAVQPMILLDAVGRIRSANRAFLKLLSKREEDILKKGFSSLLEGYEDKQSVYQKFMENLLKYDKWEGELIHRRDSGELIHGQAYFFALDYPKDAASYYIGFYHQTEVPPQSLDEKLHLHMDRTTHLNTTPIFLEKLAHTILREKKRGGVLTVFYLDIYQMGHFNETYGLLRGDCLLHNFSEALGQALPKDSLLSRVGGDSFAFVLHDLRNHSETHRQLEDILTSVEEHTHFRTDLSMPILHIGGASYPDSGDEAQTLYKYAKHASDLARAHPTTHVVYHKKQRES
ncbi:MAG: sensor domain-containing diguanylate cyclase [Alphaproteobacteria bacterium]|nr:sensor domain-containing diguanylate cyclase [Alphaproteobacteria bacterium]